MKNIKIFDRRLGFSLGAASILFGTMAPAIVPALASADSQITSRSVQMSSSAPSGNVNNPAQGTNVSYAMNFTPNEGDGTNYYDMAVEFCSDSPLIGAPCTGPTSLVVGNTTSGPGATTASPAGTITLSNGTSTGVQTLKNSGGTVSLAGNDFIVFAAQIKSGISNTVTVSGITNPDPADAAHASFYARIMIFGTDDSNGTSTSPNWAVAGPHSTAAAGVTGSGSESTTGMVDDGSVAMSTSSEIGISAAVLESLQFCVFGDPLNSNTSTSDGSTANDSTYLGSLTSATNGPSANCTPTATSGSTSTNIQLGQTISTGVVALQTNKVSYGAGWSQLSTNATHGAIVYLKTSNTCVGLSRDGGADGCKIPGSTGTNSSGFFTPAAGTAHFGLTFGGGSSPAAFAAPSGTQSGAIAINSNYVTNYAMIGGTAGQNTSTADANSATGLEESTTSPYGGYVYGTSQQPAADQDVPFGMAAAIANNTPAGLYKANLDLIAVGIF